MRSTSGSRPDRVCIRVSKHTFWIRWRDSTHQARRMMNRRACGTTVTAVPVMMRMTVSQAVVTALASSHIPAVPVTRTMTSVRNRQMTPAALCAHLDERPVQDVGVVAVVAGRRLRHRDHPAH